MSDNIKVAVQVESNLKDATTQAKKFTEELKKAADIASSIKIPSMQQAASGGTRTSSQTRAYSQAAAGSRSSSENVEYGIARAGGAGTGAASRDFAKQAQGLGGLVHLYATFAANLFAVGAAFTALKNAADTTNMIKGLDQLGAASGRNLGGLSKEVVKLTDGAVSLRDAMEATAKATSAGMSDADLKRMAVGAKQASQALGVAMPDALSRLSRGITKLEPELLDELGIFVRVDKAAADYARSLGKPVSALTEFERRNAFAVATLDQVEKKFGAISLAANPYDKLLSSLKDVMQTGLELVNKVLGPIAKLLAESPTGLATALAAVGALLLKQALPTIGNIKENMQQQAEMYRKLANAKVKDAENALSKEVERNASAAKKKAEDSIKATKEQLLEEHRLRKIASDNAASEAQANAEAIRDQIASFKTGGSFKKNSKALAILDKDWADVEEKDLKTLASLEKQFNTKGDTDKAAMYGQASALLKKHIELEKEHQRVLLDGAKIDEDAKGKQAKLEDEYQKNLAASRKEVEAYVKTLPVSKAAHDANSAAKGREIASNASYTSSILGMKAGWKELNEEIKKAKASGEIGKVQGGLATLRGGFGILTQGVSSFLNTWGVWGQAIAAGGVALAFLADHLSNTTKEAAETQDALKSLASGVENVTRTLDFIDKKAATEFLSVESIQARATAIGELSNSMVNMLKKADDQFAKMNWFDKGMNFIKSMFNEDLAADVGEGMGKSLSKAMEGIDLTKNKDALENIRKDLGVDSLFDTKAVSAAFTKLEREGESGRKKAEELAKAMQKIGHEGQVAAAKATEFKQALEQTAKSFKTFSNSFIPSDNFSKLGADIMTQAQKMTLALEEPATAIASMQELLKNPENIALLPESARQSAIEMRSEIKGMYEDYSLVNKQIHELDKGLELISAEMKRIGEFNTDNTVNTDYANLADQKKILLAQKGMREGEKSTQEVGINQATSKFAEIAKAQFVAGAAIIGERLSAEWGKVGTAVGNTVAGILGNTKAGIELRAQYEKQALAGQLNLIKSQQDLIKSNYVVAETIRLKDIGEQLRDGKSSKTGKPLEAKEIANLEQEALSRAKGISEIQTGKMQGMSKRMSADLGSFSQEAIQAAQALEGMAVQIASIMDQISSSDLKERVDIAKAAIEKEKERTKAEGDALALRKESLNLVKLDNDLISENSSLEQASLDTQILLNKHKQEQLELDKQRVSLKTIISAPETNAQLKSAAEKDLDILNRTTNAYMVQRQQSELVNQNTKLAIGLLNDKYAVESKILKQTQEQQKHELEMKKERLGTDKARLDAIKNTGTISEVEYVEEEYRIKYEMLKLESDTQIQAIEFAKQDFKLKQQLVQDQFRVIAAEAEAGKAKIAAEESIMRAKAKTTKDEGEKAAYNSAAESLKTAGSEYSKVSAIASSSAISAKMQADAMLANYDQQIARQKEITEQKQKTLDIEKQSAIANAKIADISASLVGIFGDKAGKYIEFVKAFQNLTTSSSLYSNGLVALNTNQEKLISDNTKLEQLNTSLAISNDKNTKALNTLNDAGATSVQDRVAAITIEKEIATNKEKILTNDIKIAENKAEQGKYSEKAAKLDKSSTKANIEGTMKLLSTSKMFFKEKSSAYKAIEKVEKAYMVFRMAMQAQEILMNIKGAVVGAGKAVINAIGSMPFPLNIAAGVATAAVVYKLLSSIGGGSGESVSAASISSADVRELGDGQSYQNGQIVEDYSAGVFGDTKAKSETIANSLEIIKNTSIEGLRYQGQMVRSLEKMVAAITNAAESIYLIPGIRKGESLDPSQKLGEINSSWTSQSPTMLDRAFQNFGSNLPIVGGIINKIASKVWGGKTTTNASVERSGVQFVGTLGDVIKNLDGSISRYADILIETKTDGGWFGKDKTSTTRSTQTSNLNENEDAINVRTALSDSISSMSEMFVELGSLVGDSVEERLLATNITKRIELKDLEAGTDIQEYLQQQISAIMDSVALSVFPYMEDFRKFGEGMGETVVRVVRTMQVFEQAMSNMQIPLNVVAETELERSKALIAISDDIVDRAGGIEEFIKIYENYSDKFLTQQEKLLPVQEEVSRVMAQLGYASVDTRTEFRALVSSIDMTKESGRTLFLNLMDISESFDEVAKAAEDLVSKVGLAASNFSSILKDGILGKLSVSDLGVKVAESIEDGINNALVDSFINNITAQINNSLITPLITAITTGTYTASLVSKQSMQGIIDTANTTAQALSEIFSNPEYARAMKEITVTISESIQQVVGVAQIASGSISKLLKDYQSRVKSSNDKVISAYKSQITTLESVKNKFKDFAKSLREFAQSLLTSNLSPLTPAEKYAESKKLLESTFVKAAAGDEDALSKLQGVSNDFLTISRDYYASSEAYTTDFNRVQQILEQAASASDGLATTAETQIKLAQDQVLALGGILDNTGDIADSLEKALADAKAEKEAADKDTDKSVADALVAAFTTIDKDFSKGLTGAELVNSGLASDGDLKDIYARLDANTDGILTAAEVLARSSEDTTFTLTSLETIFANLRMGKLDGKGAKEYIDSLIAANASKPEAESTLTASSGGSSLDNTITSIIDNAYNKVLGRTAYANEKDYLLNAIKDGTQSNITLMRDMLAHYVKNGTVADANSAKAWVKPIIVEAYKAQYGITPRDEIVQTAIEGLVDDSIKLGELKEYFTTSINSAQEYSALLTSKFTSIDTNLDGFISKQELLAKEAGLTTAQLTSMYTMLDTNTDGQISQLEAIANANGKASFTLDSLVPINEAIKNNTMTTANGIAYLNSMIEANRSAGITGGDLANTGQGTLISSGTNTSTGQFINSKMQSTLGRQATSDEMSAILGYFSSGGMNQTTFQTELVRYMSQNGGAADKAAANDWMYAYARDAIYQAAGNQHVYTEDTIRALMNEILSGSINSFAGIYGAGSKYVPTEQPSYNYAGAAGGGSRTSPGIGLVGEQGPELLVTHGPSRIWSHEATKGMLNQGTDNTELIAEIRKLNAKIDSLEQTVARGDMMNVQATQQNTNEVAAAVENSASLTTHANRVKNRVTLV